jgi:hypothetical protein
MKLISCPECAVVLDQDKLYYLTDRRYGYTEDFSYNTDQVEYEGNEYYLAIICPVCKEKFASSFKPR